MINSTQPDIIIGTESWLDPSVKNNECFLQNFKIFRRDRPEGQRGGGVFVAIRYLFMLSQVTELESECEMVWAKLEIISSKCTYIGSFYHPHTENYDNMKQFDISINKLNSFAKGIIVLGGDFNLAGWDWATNTIKPNYS